MFDYAKISAIRSYVESGRWPLKIPHHLTALYKQAPAKPLGLGRKVIRLLKPQHDENQSPQLPYYYCGHPYFSGTRSWEYPWVMDILASRKPPQTIMDIGCGNSEFLFQYLELGYEVTGVDRIKGPEYPDSELTPDFVEKWEHLIQFINGDATAIPSAAGSADIVICLSVMEHAVSRTDAQYHLKLLDEFKRVLRPGGLLIVTCDTFTNPRVAYGGLPGWGPEGWSYERDIEHLGMTPLDAGMPVRDREYIDRDEDTYFIPPSMYFDMGYGTGFELFGEYHRMTSIGYALVK
jgi:SAM-dependent methyltransferase